MQTHVCSHRRECTRTHTQLLHSANMLTRCESVFWGRKITSLLAFNQISLGVQLWSKWWILTQIFNKQIFWTDADKIKVKVIKIFYNNYHKSGIFFLSKTLRKKFQTVFLAHSGASSFSFFVFQTNLLSRLRIRSHRWHCRRADLVKICAHEMQFHRD